MARRLARLLSAASLLAAALTLGCRAPSGRMRASVQDPFSSAIPDISSWGGKVWFAERTQSLGVYAVELRELAPLQFRPRRTLRLFVIRGRVRMRLGGRERILGRGSYALVPPRQTYRILPLDDAPAKILMLLSPDGHDAVVIEMPNVSRRLLSGVLG